MRPPFEGLPCPVGGWIGIPRGRRRSGFEAGAPGRVSRETSLAPGVHAAAQPRGPGVPSAALQSPLAATFRPLRGSLRWRAAAGRGLSEQPRDVSATWPASGGADGVELTLSGSKVCGRWPGAFQTGAGMPQPLGQARGEAPGVGSEICGLWPGFSTGAGKPPLLSGKHAPEVFGGLIGAGGVRLVGGVLVVQAEEAGELVHGARRADGFDPGAVLDGGVRAVFEAGLDDLVDEAGLGFEVLAAGA
ncbi:MAG: hypothetical protein JWN36_3359, partial [Microbacteriaceae bacterium]|nr:hypothetical protein [Microbacteriaceae bacterium]